MGEGAAVLVLEEPRAPAAAAPRCSPSCAAGMSGTPTTSAPAEDGSGRARCGRPSGRWPVRAAGVAYVNAHATSTPMGDDIEGAAIDAFFAGETAAPAGQQQR